MTFAAQIPNAITVFRIVLVVPTGGRDRPGGIKNGG